MIRLLNALLVGILLVQLFPSETREAAAENTSMLADKDLILPLNFTPLILEKPMTNSSWQNFFRDLTFQKITTLVLELEPLALPGSLDALEVEVTINGRTTAQRYEGSDYSFDAATQLSLLVDATTRKLDGTTDIQVILKPHWGFLEAGVQVELAQLWSFEPRPAFGQGRQKVPLTIEWNSYHLGGIPPLSLYFETTGFLGNGSNSNQLQLSIYLEMLGISSPWVEVFLSKERIYQGSEGQKWINTTIAPPEQNPSLIDFTVEFHPDRSADRYKEVIIQLEVFAEFSDNIDTRAVEREQILAQIPKISVVIANFLILNAIILPLIHFRKNRLEERSKGKEDLISPKNTPHTRSRGFLSQKRHNR
ncbi:MAG: hypothetical protein ACFFB3_05175 [Candidatus Hodarchaeota archaeon]